MRVLVLGSTGSIGVQALEVIARRADMDACGLACGARDEEMARPGRRARASPTPPADGGGSRPDADLADLIDALASPTSC